MELNKLPDDSAAGRVRRLGAGRKKITPESQLEQNLNSLLKLRIAGDPDQETIVFTDLSPRSLSEKLQLMGTPTSAQTIRQWMDDQGLRLRSISKVISPGSSTERNRQFERIAELIDQYQADGNPYFSVDTKAKEFLGQLYRSGRVRSTQPFKAFNYDFPSLAESVIIPHGIYDPVRNRRHINIGLSHDTTLFACDSLQWYWNRIGKQCYQSASSLLLLCDCGGKFFHFLPPPNSLLLCYLNPSFQT